MKTNVEEPKHQHKGKEGKEGKVRPKTTLRK